MKNFQNADFNKKENALESTNSLSKSADMLSTRDLILSLNDSLISRKSKEYNFDFAKAASYDSDQTGFLLSQKPSFSQNLANLNENPLELNLIANKTASNLIISSEPKNHNKQNSFLNKNYMNVIFENNEEKNNFNNEFKSKQNIGNFSRNSNSDAISKIKERLQSLQQKKKFEFYEAKNQKQDFTMKEIELEDKTNFYFE